MSAGTPPPGGGTSLAGLGSGGSARAPSPNTAPAAGGTGAGTRGSRPGTLLASYATLPAWALDVQASQTSQGKQVVVAGAAGAALPRCRPLAVAPSLSLPRCRSRAVAPLLSPPCRRSLAVASSLSLPRCRSRIKGLTAVAVFEHGASNCYKVQKPALEACTAKYVPLPPPAYFEAIKLGGDVATTDAAFLNASDDTAGADPSGIVPAGLPAGGVLPPDNKAVKGHGNAKANRYKPKSDSGYRGRGGGGRKTRARTREAATLTAALRTSRLAQLHCSTCTKAGRIGPEYDGHKAPQCPYDTAAVQARASVTIVLSSSSDDGDVAFTADLSHETGVAGLPPPAGGRKHTSRGASGVAANASYARKVAFAAAPLSLSDSDDDDDAPLGALLGGGGRGGQRQALRRGRSAGRGRAYPAARVVTRVYDTEDDEAGTSSAPAPKKRRHTKLHKPAGAGP